MERLDMSTILSVCVLIILTVAGCAEMEADSYFNRALTYGKKGQYDQAIADYNKAIKINPRFILAYKNRGIVMMKLGNTKMACSDWKQTCELGDCHAYETAKRNGWCK